jgi:hypothetical protein
MLHQRVLALKTSERDWVEYGFARFSQDSVIIDEPLVIFAATHHLSSTPHGLVDHVLGPMAEPAGRGEHFEAFLAVYMSLAFGPGVALSDVFNFGNNVPQWAREPGVELVIAPKCCYKLDYSPDNTARVPITLCKTNGSAEDTVKWFENPTTAMCLPDKHFGPDLVCFLRLPNRTIICVIIQSKYRSMARLDKRDQEKALSTLVPNDFYRKRVSSLFSQ